MERYSDSAAAFVMLDASNSSVYKQLYRAAKAKSKLKLRVSLLQPPVKRIPKAVTVEDALDTANDTPVATAEPVHPIPSPASTNGSPRIHILEKFKEYDACYIGSAARRFEFEDRLQQVLDTNKELEKEFERISSQMAECKASTSTPAIPKLSGPLCQVCPASGMAFAVCCNSCEENIPDAHYHCSTCDDGDFDLCPACVERGITCYSDDHWLIKRTVNNGQIVNSTTETIATKPTLQAIRPSLDAQPAIPDAPASEGFRPAKPILNDKAMKTPVSRVDTSTAVGDKKANEDVAFQHALLGVFDAVFDATKDDKKRADTAAAGLRLPGDTTRTCNQCVSGMRLLDIYSTQVCGTGNFVLLTLFRFLTQSFQKTSFCTALPVMTMISASPAS